ncbi:MAG: T9SS type A sorting domain-containing protein [Schleiferiaceae bacterium]|nr:T9SS type A sorting domain-containing protein [Schleiferiaceae bacterium]
MTSNQTYGRKWDAFPQWTIFGDHGSANSVNSGPLTLTDTPPTLGLKAYPNPNTGQFTLSNQSEWDCRVQVWNLNGQLLQTIAINSQEDLSIVSEEYPTICLLIWLDLNGHVIKHEQLIHIKSS